MRIRLEGTTWSVGSPLPDGEGGFGRVFDAEGEDGVPAVAKFVPKEPGAKRELLIDDSLGAAAARNVIPILDVGEHENDWVIVMPKADESLAQHLRSADAPLDLDEVIGILHDVAAALAELTAIQPAVVHRDLKPQNILLMEGRWCLADFGIARYAEATTAPDTRKFSFTRPYAAPEQWRLERATPATDVYAFGVIAYQLLSGQLPFGGHDLRQQHLTDDPPPLSSGTVRLRTLIEECLWKAPSARPSAANVLARLEMAAQEPATRGASKLAQVNHDETKRLARDHAAEVENQQCENHRAELFAVAERSFEVITSSAVAAIEADATNAVIDISSFGSGMAFVAQLCDGKLGVSRPQRSPMWDGPFTVIAHAAVSVNQGLNHRGYEGRSHSIWFCDAVEKDRFAWYETAFMSSPFSGANAAVDPFSLDPSSAEVAFQGVIGTIQLAWPFEELDPADLSGFVDRWMGWFAEVAGQSLQHPSIMPEKSPHGSWRRR